MLKGLGQLGDMAKMMSKAKEMQDKMVEVQESLDQLQVTGEAGAGLVTVTANAKGVVVAIDVDPSILVASEKEIVEDLIVAAIKDAQSRGAEAAQTEMRRIAEEMGLPPGMDMPF